MNISMKVLILQDAMSSLCDLLWNVSFALEFINSSSVLVVCNGCFGLGCSDREETMEDHSFKENWNVTKDELNN